MATAHKTAFVIGTHDRDWYLESLLAVVSRQVPTESICITDDASTNANLLAMLDRAEADGCHIIRCPEHSYSDATLNRGIKWAIGDYRLTVERPRADRWQTIVVAQRAQ